MGNSIFEISDLVCAYDHNEQPVFLIKDLTIPQNAITTILGKSGSGKSTLIETLGLMNRTIKSGKISFFPDGNNIAFDRNTWDNPRYLAEIRKKNFSFIFQEDYLMPNYTPKENMMISYLIQSPKQNDNIKLILEWLLKSLGLDTDDLLNRKPSEMAGGQKQRLSFIRALLKKFTVLFGDEPTGNLDEGNSIILLNLLKEFLKSDKLVQMHDRSAILVSHNIGLSVDYSDKIIVLTEIRKERNNAPSGVKCIKKEEYEVLPENILEKKGPALWTDYFGKEYSDDSLNKYIKTLFKEASDE